MGYARFCGSAVKRRDCGFGYVTCLVIVLEIVQTYTQKVLAGARNHLRNSFAMDAAGAFPATNIFYHSQPLSHHSVGRGGRKDKPFSAAFMRGERPSSPQRPSAHHTPVMAREAVAALRVKPAGKYIDCTCGEGGHSLAILSAATPPPSALCLDMDGQALQTARRRLRMFDSVAFAQANYADVAALAPQSGFGDADGALLDLGLSSLQLDVGARGFSFRHEAPLDMRFDAAQALTAHEFVNGYAEQAIADIIFRFGEERRSRRIARAIVRSRPVRTTTQLADIIAKSVGRPRGRIHPATRTFQAIRIAVNGELDNLQRGLHGAIQTLGKRGRLAVITYHSVEDRIVKTTLRRESADCVCPPETPQCVCSHTPAIRLVNRRVIKPSPDEIRANPRSRSARLRVAERI